MNLEEVTDILRKKLPSLDCVTNLEWQDTLKLRHFVQHEFQLHGYLSFATFERVLDWKLRKQRKRTEKYRKNITGDLVREISGCFYRIKHENEEMERKIKIDILSAIPGVGIGVASTILTFAHPDQYAIIDKRVWEVLYQEVKNSFTIDDYGRYLINARQIAESLDCDVHVVDFLLWKEYEDLHPMD